MLDARGGCKLVRNVWAAVNHFDFKDQLSDGSGGETLADTGGTRTFPNLARRLDVTFAVRVEDVRMAMLFE